MNYTISPAAERDIDEITSYIAEESINSALKLLDSIYEAFDMLAENPLIGYLREKVTDRPIRFWPFKWHYIIIYKPINPIEIVRILSGYRDIPGLI